MTFPDRSYAGSSLPTWHAGKEGAAKADTNGHATPPKKPKGTFQVIKRSLAAGFVFKRNKIINSISEASTEAENEVANAYSSSPASKRPYEAPFRLADLPRELRDRIYDLMICDPGTDPCDKFNPPNRKSFRTRPLFYNLEYNACILATSHQIQHEFAQILVSRKERSAVPAVMTVLDEAGPYVGRGPYYYKNYQPIPVYITHLTFFAPFVEFLQSVEVRIGYYPLPGRTRWDPEVTIPDDVQINVTEPLVAALEGGKNLRSVRIRLYLASGKFELGWVSREMERFKAIPGFELVQLDVIKTFGGGSGSMTHTLWVLPRGAGEVGWQHAEEDIDFFYSWRGPHASGHDVRCFECWREVQKAGGDEFPEFRGGNRGESFLKLKKLEAPDFTWDDWRKWKAPEW